MGRNIFSFAEFEELPEEEKLVLMGEVDDKALSSGTEDEFPMGEEPATEFEIEGGEETPSEEGSEETWGEDSMDFGIEGEEGSEEETPSEEGEEENIEIEDLDGSDEEEFSFETEGEEETPSEEGEEESEEEEEEETTEEETEETEE